MWRRVPTKPRERILQADQALERALLDDFLKYAHSNAYGYGAKYLGKLAVIAEDTDPSLSERLMDHEAYLQELHKSHRRKKGFWRRVGLRNIHERKGRLLLISLALMMADIEPHFL